MAIIVGTLPSHPVRTARHLWRTQRGLVLLFTGLVLFLFILNPFSHYGGPHLPKNYMAGKYGGDSKPPAYAPPAAEDHSELRAFNGEHQDEWEAIKIADAKRRKEEESRKQKVAEDRRKQEDEQKRKMEEEESRRKLTSDEKSRMKEDGDRRKQEEEEARRKKAEADAAKKDKDEDKDGDEDKSGEDDSSTKDSKSSIEKAEEERKKAELDPATSQDRDQDTKDETPDAGGATTLDPSRKLSVTLDSEASGRHNITNASHNAHNITTTLVVGRIDKDVTGVQWIHDTLDSITHKRIYIVDDPHAPLHLDKNKGREAMVYIRYILDFYDDLDDVTLFFHSSRSAWHNNVLFNRDAAVMINNLQRPYVLDVGYFNARCELYPGCPSPRSTTVEEEGWVKFNPTKAENDVHKERNADLFNIKLWDAIFPNRTSDPEWLSEPCCSQFALSRDMIRSVPLEQYKTIYEWLFTTDEFDGYTGRIMEYVWQYLFLQQEKHCPDMSECYCQGYGLCLIDDSELREYNDVREDVDSTLGLIGEENTRLGCDIIEEEKPRLKCEADNKFLDTLNKLRKRKGMLENKLPRRYGIMDP